MLDKLSDYDFNLPPGAIAQKPVSPREAARLLVPKTGSFSITILPICLVCCARVIW